MTYGLKRWDGTRTSLEGIGDSKMISGRSKGTDDWIKLFDADSKHGNYHPVPAELSDVLPDIAIDKKWRDPRPRIRLISQYLGSLQSGDQVVELGCNTGYQLFALARSFPTLQFIGVENNELHAEFVLRAADRLGLNNIKIECRSDTPQSLAERWPGATVLDFNVAHHAGSDFAYASVQVPMDWWKSGLKRWLAATPSFTDYWFSAGFRLGGNKAMELHDPTDPAGFARKVMERLPKDTQVQAVWGARGSKHGLVYSPVQPDNLEILNEWAEQALSREIYRGEYFSRPLFRFMRRDLNGPSKS